MKAERDVESFTISHLIILVSYTVLTVPLLIATFVLGWDVLYVPFYILGLLTAWFMEIMEAFSGVKRVWIYTALLMLEFFEYGIQNTSTYDIAPLMILLLVVLSIAKIRGLMVFGVCVYYLTMGADVLREINEGFIWTPLAVLRLIFHLLLVLMAGMILDAFIRLSNREKTGYEMLLSENKEERKVANQSLTVFERELKKPLQVIGGELLVLKGDLKKLGSDADLDAITLSEIILRNRIEDIEDFALLVSGKCVVKEMVYNPVEMLYELQRKEYYFLKDLPVDIIANIDPNLPEGILGDEKKISKIIRILIANSLGHTKKGVINIKLYAVKKDEAVNVCIEVEDTGSGVSESDLARIMERLGKGEVAERRSGGLGVGLYIVHGFAKAMGGSVHIQSIFGKGTRVCVSIPCKVMSAAPCMNYDEGPALCAAFISPHLVAGTDEASAYYLQMFMDMQEKLGVKIYLIQHETQLSLLMETYDRVCYFVPPNYYESDPVRYENMSGNMDVCVIANRKLSLTQSPSLNYIKKPFSNAHILAHLEKVAKRMDRRRHRALEDAPSLKNFLLPDMPDVYKKKQYGTRKIRILTDSMSDISMELSRRYDVDVIPFEIITSGGSFRDGKDISQETVLSEDCDMRSLRSAAPRVEAFRTFFEENSKSARELIYISCSSKLSMSFRNAKEASSDLENVTVFDSGSVSAGLLMMVVEACECVQRGNDVKTIIKRLTSLKRSIRTTFSVESMSDLKKERLVSSFLIALIRTLAVSPVLKMKRGRLKTASLHMNSKYGESKNYVRFVKRKLSGHMRKRVVISYAGVSRSRIEEIRLDILKSALAKEVTVAKCSTATVINASAKIIGISYDVKS